MKVARTELVSEPGHKGKKMKRKLGAAQKAERKRRRLEFETVFIGGKMKRIRRPHTIDGMNVEEFLSRNADPLWLHQNEMWELIKDGENQAQALWLMGADTNA